MPTVTSFDVFDTLLVRGLARPIDVFTAAAERAVPADVEPAARAARVAEIRRERRSAEARAQRRAGTDAVSLTAIYAEMGSLSRLGLDLDVIREAELAVERDHVRPVAAGRRRLEAARTDSGRVVFISDMYLPTEHIRESLERFELIKPHEPLYVSGEVGTSKRSGGLFRHVIAQETIAADALVHVGDDPMTDDAAPRALGIAVDPLHVGRLDRFERAGLDNLAAPVQVVSRTVGAVRRARVVGSGVDPASRYAASLGASVAGPLFGTFVAWTLERAHSQGIRRLYFVSRDGQILKRLAEAVREPDGPECRYLYGSRQAWLLPSVRRVDPHELRWVLEPEPGPVSASLAKLGLDAGGLRAALARHGLDPEERVRGRAAGAFWELVSEVEPTVLDRAAEARSVVREYFAQEGLTDDDNWALVDLGWRMNGQRAVARILDVDPARLQGFYLGASRRRVPLAESGRVYPFIVEDEATDAHRLPEAWSWNNRPFLEHVLAPGNHGTCRGYRRAASRVEPVLEDERETVAGRAFRTVLQDVAVTSARELNEAGLLHGERETVRAYGILSGRQALERPLRSEAEALAWVTVSDDQLDTHTRELAPALDLRELGLRLQERVGKGVERDFTNTSRWPAGSAARASAPVRVIRGFARLVRSARAGR